MENHLFTLFAGAWDPQPVEPLSVSVPQPSTNESKFIQVTKNGSKGTILSDK